MCSTGIPAFTTYGTRELSRKALSNLLSLSYRLLRSGNTHDEQTALTRHSDLDTFGRSLKIENYPWTPGGR